jgi:Spy/CpxP family protein refolding chaperone
MNRALKWKLIVGFVLVFVAGGITGAFFGASHARHLFFAQPHRGMMSERMLDHFRAQLNLTPEQVAKISPIIDKAAGQLEEIRGNTGRRVHETIAEAHREMAADLTEEQRAKLQAIEARHRRWHHQAWELRESTPPEPETSPQ